jgi:hypothetical protein
MKAIILIIMFVTALMNVACSTLDLVTYAAAVVLEDKVTDAVKNKKSKEDKVSEESQKKQDKP